MLALVQDVYGTSEVLRLAEVDRPEPAADEVLVRIAAASVNAADWHIMRGEPTVARLMDRKIFARKSPREPIRGRDFAGTIEAVGSGVVGWQVGDEVLGEDEATFAEYAVVPQACLARKPEGLSFQDAAALPLAATTADLCLTAGAVRPGHRVLVVGASGGVGTFAVQLAVARGATVDGVCSTRNADLVASLGAAKVFDYTLEDFTRAGERYDVVLDLVGNRGLRDLRRVVAPGGTLVLSGGGNPGDGRLLGPVGLMARGGLFGRLLGLRVQIPMAQPDGKRLAELVDMVSRGELRPVIDRAYPFAEAAEAIRHLEVEHARGKIVVTV
ncbi:MULTISPECIES: NAD(P)-dependent alcohol dehydrogenase [unclassified Nocardioides]|uniref:NAD(P)-dependent alcohol dehydrogenase n=1 Tax=unclassified Nocardioides TaxID=2615069 RepID=UPI0006F4171C|nr:MULTISPECIES: NAD(P)-dependent alcohol dehydrogenase [unclassified Nocardioides]KRA32372.1 NADPH:quinone reductase [Nocardioides sp. Root614]KRA89024.1 NADPH:quinone reductase [Nocardioides sp. Root682]